MTLAPLPPSGATGAAATGITGLSGPNNSSTVRPSARASAMATRNDGSLMPDSTAETACRDTPAMLATCCWENPRACRASRNRAPLAAPCPSLTALLPGHYPGSHSALAYVM